MTYKDINELLYWLNSLPNEHLQRINSESNKILMARYDKQLKQQNEYQVNMAVALMLLGHRQTKDTIKIILNKLEKTSGVHYPFDGLISKLTKRLNK